MRTCWGVLTDKDGLASSLVGGRRDYRACPSGEFRSVQAPVISIDQGHDRNPVGRLLFLERDRAGSLWAVGEVTDAVEAAVYARVDGRRIAVPHELYWSAEWEGNRDFTDIELRSVAVTPFPARLAARPLRFAAGNASAAAYTSSDGFEKALLRRASEYDLKRHGNPIVIQGEHPHRPAFELRYAGTIETRAVADVDVSSSLRQVTLLIAPARVPSQIFEHGRSFVEEYDFGCFASSEAEPRKVKLNRDHRIERSCGVAQSIDAWSELGCVGRFKVSRTRDGDEVLELLADGVAACSAGFALEPNGDSWDPGRKHRLIRRARLDHVGITAAPAHQTALLGMRNGELAGV